MRYPETAMRLRKILAEKNMTAQELANRSGVGKSSISHYINGNNEPHTLNAGKMADVLGVNAMWLMGYDVKINEGVDIKVEWHKNESKVEKYKHLLRYVELLNPEGIAKLEERAEELTEMKKYKKEDSDDVD